MQFFTVAIVSLQLFAFSDSAYQVIFFFEILYLKKRLLKIFQFANFYHKYGSMLIFRSGKLIFTLYPSKPAFSENEGFLGDMTFRGTKNIELPYFRNCAGVRLDLWLRILFLG